MDATTIDNIPDIEKSYNLNTDLWIKTDGLICVGVQGPVCGNFWMSGLSLDDDSSSSLSAHSGSPPLERGHYFNEQALIGYLDQQGVDIHRILSRVDLCYFWDSIPSWSPSLPIPLGSIISKSNGNIVGKIPCLPPRELLMWRTNTFYVDFGHPEFVEGSSGLHDWARFSFDDYTVLSKNGRTGPLVLSCQTHVSADDFEELENICCAWIAQAEYLSYSKNLKSEANKDLVLLSSITFKLESQDDLPQVFPKNTYLYVAVPKLLRCTTNSSVSFSLSWGQESGGEPAYFWSCSPDPSDPRLDLDSCKNVGLPILKPSIKAPNWRPYEYAAARRYQYLKGCDPKTQQYAEREGFPLLKSNPLNDLTSEEDEKVNCTYEWDDDEQVGYLFFDV
ncbi:hypothetical protein VKT23_000172 [Stygiomarasmius scandens]|uniref:Uncharacterized protein n=1 Tax=Marasmiellus scandens TaxID=2682957 RepID=A0ABR1K3J9_9AGAR